MARLIENQQHLAEWVRSQRGKIDIAVAFWGDGAVEMLGLSSKRKFRILLDLATGGTNPYEVRKLLSIAPDSVKCLDRLHAKVYVTDKELVVGSANASANGLGVEGKEASHWHELGLLTDNAPPVAEAKNWFNRQWRSAELITEPMLQAAEKAWKNRQRNRPMTRATKSQNLLDAVIANPSEFRNRGIWVVVFVEDLSKKAKAEVAAIEENTGHAPHVFENWPAMPANAKLVSFSKFAGEDFKKDGDSILFTGERKQRGWLKFVTPSEVAGYQIGPVSDWRKFLKRAEAADPKAWEREGIWLRDLAEFVDLYGPNADDVA